MRRRSFDVITSEGLALRVLAYDPTDAEEYGRKWCTRNSRTFVRTRPTPRRKRTWEFDRTAIRRAMDAMGIGGPLPRLESPFAARGQTTQAYFDVTLHAPVIRCYAGCTPEDASRYIWHELAHLMQYKRDGHGSYAQRTATQARAYRYEDRPYEIEAREWECLAETDPLVKVIR